MYQYQSRNCHDRKFLTECEVEAQCPIEHEVENNDQETNTEKEGNQNVLSKENPHLGTCPFDAEAKTEAT